MKLEQARHHAHALLTQMRPFCERCEIAGSIRRGKPEVKDIEIVAIPKWIADPRPPMTLFEVAATVERRNLLYEWAVGQTSLRWIKPGTAEIVWWQPKPDGRYWRGLIADGLKLDLFLAQPDNFGIIMAIRTGSAEFSTALMARAKRMGLPCADGYLTRGGERLATVEEQDVFALLELDYVEPPERRCTKPESESITAIRALNVGVGSVRAAARVMRCGSSLLE